MARPRKAPARKPHKSQKNVGVTATTGRGSSSQAIATRRSSSLEFPPLDSPEDDKPSVTGVDDGQGNVMLDTGIPKEKPDHLQSWYRPKDSKARKWAEKILIKRTAGHSDAEIAKALKIGEASVRQYIWLAKKNGWIGEDGEIPDLEAELAMNIDRKVVRNLSSILDGRMTNYQTFEMTKEAAKGRGMFKNHEKTESSSQSMSVVAIQIIGAPPQGAPLPAVIEDNVGGVPAYVEGEVSDADRLLPSPPTGDAV